MALVACQECGMEISERAPSCPRCGYAREATTVQSTSKRWKALQLGSALLGFPLAGLTVTWPGPTAPHVFAVGTALCVVTYVYARLMAWWHHA